jgi:tetratricopeptide (TPR) repeat protein
VGFVCSDRKGRGRENLALVWALGTLAFLGPFVDAKVLVVGPVLLALLAILRRPLPWLALSATAASSLAYLSVRHTAVANLMLGVDFIHNPLVAEGNLTRLVNGARLVWHHAVRILEPFSLSADASFRELPVLAASSPWLWVQAAALVGGIGYAIARATRRFPAVVAGLAFYVLTILPHASVFFVAPIIASDRSVHAAGLGLVLALAAAIERIRDARLGGASVPKKRWIPATALLVVTALLAGRSWIRARDWGDPQSMALRLPEEAPESSWSHQKAAETLLRRLEAGGDTARPELLEKAVQYATRAVEIFPVDLRSESGRAEEVLGRVLLRSRKYAEAAQWFTEASKHLGAQRIPELEPLLYRRRAECFLNLNRPAEALADLDPYILLLAHDKKAEDPLAYNFRGLARGMLGNLDEAIVDFDRALSLRSDIPEFWNNRGYCRFRKKDYRGAIEDYTKGMELCRAQGLIRAAQGHSVTSFLTSMVSVHESIAAEARAAGDAAGANQASQESMRLRVEAARLLDTSAPRDAPRADPGPASPAPTSATLPSAGPSAGPSARPSPGPSARPSPGPTLSPSPAPASIPAPPVPRP